MAAAGCIDLDDRYPMLLDAVRILAREEVALDNSHAQLALELLHGLFQHGRLAGARRSHEIDDVNALLPEHRLILRRDTVIFT